MRELRPTDLDGSAGLYRLKEELTRRVNAASRPTASPPFCSRKSSSSDDLTDGARTNIDQDALAAEWGVAMEKETAAPAPAADTAAAVSAADEAAAQWAAMADEGGGQ